MNLLSRIACSKSQYVLMEKLLITSSIKSLSGMIFENLNSLETLNLQNNKLMHVPEDVMEPILDTLRVVDLMGK